MATSAASRAAMKSGGSVSGGSRRSSHNSKAALTYELDVESSAFPFPLDEQDEEESSAHDSLSDAEGMNIAEDRRTANPKHRPALVRHPRPRLSRPSASPDRKSSHVSLQLPETIAASAAGGGYTSSRKGSAIVARTPSPAKNGDQTLAILLQRNSFDEGFGLDLTGGMDVGQELVISDVHPRGVAQLAGLLPHDVLVHIDGVPTAETSHDGAVQIFKNNLQVWVKVHRSPSTRPERVSLTPSNLSTNANRHIGQARKTALITGSGAGSGRVSPSIPDNGSTTTQHELDNRAYAWIDLDRQPCSPPPDEDTLAQHSPTSLPERSTTLLVSEDIHLGLLIRGGLEYGLGIYVTGLDKASAAQAADLQVGDQILSVNNYDFKRVTHSRAVKILRTHRHMNMVCRQVGKLPFAKRLSPSSTAPHLPPLDFQQEEIDLLMREASRDSDINDMSSPFLMDGLMATDGFLDDMIDLETAVNDWSKAALTIEQNSFRDETEMAHRYAHWLSVIESSAASLLSDNSQKNGLMYFVDDYLSGNLCVDALVLSFFHWIDSVPKFQLIEDIRNVIQAQDIHLYDSLTSGLKTEWMTSLSKMPLNLEESNYSLSRLTSSVSPSKSPSNFDSLMPSTGSLHLGLKSALKNSSSQFVLPTDIPVYLNTFGSPVCSSVQQSPALLSPNAILNWSPADLQENTLTLVNPSGLRQQQHPSAPRSTSPVLSRQNLPPVQNFEPNLYLSHGYSGVKGYSVDVPSYAHTPPLAQQQNGGVYSRARTVDDGYFAATPLPPLRRHSNVTRQNLSAFSQRWLDPRRLTPSPIDILPDRARDRNYAHSASPRHSLTDAEKYTGRRDSLAPSKSRPRTNTIGSVSAYSGESDRESYRDDHRDMSAEDDVSSVADLVVRNRPQSLMMNQKIGPSKSDLKLPVVIEAITVKKNAAYLGIAIEGGTDTKQILPRIINIQPNGCAHLNGQLKIGHVIISINGKKLDNLTHAQAVSLIKDTFLDKATSMLEFVVKEVHKLPSS